MILKTATPTWIDQIRYMFGANPRDVWEFEAHGLKCKVLNEWRSGTTLLVDGVVLSQNATSLEIAGRDPFLTAMAKDPSGAIRKIEVFLQAIVQVKIRVSVDGVPLSNDFV